MTAVDIKNEKPVTFPLESLEIPVDPEHTGIRMVGCGSFTLTLVASFFVLAVVINPGAVIAAIMSIIIAGAVSYTIEIYLHQRWPSGRVLRFSENEIALCRKDKAERQVDPTTHINVLTWHFVVKRNSRIKKGWYVIGLALEQADELVPIYTFASPEAFDQMPLSRVFTRLEKSKKSEDTGKAALNIRKAGEQRRLHFAEHDRGYFGAEVTFEQFQHILDYLQRNYPQWMIS